MFCSKCGAPNEEASVYCANCGAALEGDVVPEVPAEVSAEVPAEMPEELPAVPYVEESAVPADVVEPQRELSPLPVEPEVAAPPPAYLPPAAPAARKYDVNTAFLIEFLGGFFGLLGIGYMYTGRTNDGVVRLVVWLLYSIIAWVTIGLLAAIVVGLICIPFQLVIQVGVPLWSANQLKKKLLAEG
jgi:hypothetical protein